MLVGPVHPDPDQGPDARSTPVVSSSWQASTRRVSDVPPSTAIWSRCLTARATSRAVPLRGVRAEWVAITGLCLAGGRGSQAGVRQLAGQDGGVGRRHPAGVVAADVGEARLAADPQGESVGSPQARTASGSQRLRTSASRSGRSPVIRTSVGPGPAGRRSARCGRTRSGGGPGGRR